MLLDTGKYKRLSKKASNTYQKAPGESLRPIKGLGRCVGRACAWGASLTLGLAFFVVLSVGLLFVYRWMTSHTYFALKAIEVQGNERLTYGQVVESAGLSVGQNNLAVKIGEVEQRLAGVPWIESVSVKRVLPSGCVINLKERMPYFWTRSDDELYYADEVGRIIAPVDQTKFQALPLLTAEEGTADLLERLPEMVEEMNARLPLDIRKAAWVRISHGRGLEVWFEDQGLLLAVGERNWEQNLERLGLVMQDLERRGELARASHIKAHGEGVWVVSRHSSGQA